VKKGIKSTDTAASSSPLDSTELSLGSGNQSANYSGLLHSLNIQGQEQETKEKGKMMNKFRTSISSARINLNAISSSRTEDQETRQSLVDEQQNKLMEKATGIKKKRNSKKMKSKLDSSDLQTPDELSTPQTKMKHKKKKSLSMIASGDDLGVPPDAGIKERRSSKKMKSMLGSSDLQTPDELSTPQTKKKHEKKKSLSMTASYDDLGVPSDAPETVTDVLIKKKKKWLSVMEECGDQEDSSVELQAVTDTTIKKKKKKKRSSVMEECGEQKDPSVELQDVMDTTMKKKKKEKKRLSAMEECGEQEDPSVELQQAETDTAIKKKKRKKRSSVMEESVGLEEPSDELYAANDAGKKKKKKSFFVMEG